MKYYNINDNKEIVSLEEAVIKSISSEQGLFMPEYIPKLPDNFFNNLINLDLKEIALEVAKHFFQNVITEEDLKRIVEQTFDFEIPLVQLSDKIYSLELFHGPTLAFKDVGAKFMAGIFESIMRKKAEKVTVLVATSGDTGSAVANAFFQKENVKVVILYPKDKVSEIQKAQMTTFGGNIEAVEVDGNFDDCQRLVKKAFSDESLNSMLNLTSANSINIARLFPQCIYYFHAVAQLLRVNKKPIISVPSGNFGNLTAGLLAKKMGLEIVQFIAATNRNNSIPEFLVTGNYRIKPTIYTISNAMDVGNPSNFPRMKELYKDQLFKLKNDVFGSWFSDEETIRGMRELYFKYNYISDPHGAVAYLGLKNYPLRENEVGVFLETAHPIKFKEIVEDVLNLQLELPTAISAKMTKTPKFKSMKNEYTELKDILFEK